MRAASGTGGRRAARHGTLSLVFGAILVVAGLLIWWATLPTTMGFMFVLAMLWSVAASSVVTGVARLRSSAYEIAPATTLLVPARASVMCRLTGHRELFRDATGDRPAVWECRRCGAAATAHLSSSHAWICEIPLVDHTYVHVGANTVAPERWRCRRCGKTRYVAPRSAGETLTASHNEGMVVRRHEDSY